MNSSDDQILPEEITWYETPFFRRLIAVLLPPLGLFFLWRDPNRTGRQRMIGSGLIAAYILPWFLGVLGGVVLVGGLDIEWKGGFGPSLVRQKTKPNYAALEFNRSGQSATLNPAPAVPSTRTLRPYWTDFRGPKRDGIYGEQPILAHWPAEGPKLLWQQPVGGGYASFVVAEGLAFTIEQRRDTEVVAAYDLETGREVWKFAYPAQFTEWMGGDGPRATPTYSDGLLYTLGAKGDLFCFEAASGKVRWNESILAGAGAVNLRYGMAASPLVVGQAVIVVTGEPGAKPDLGVVAFHRQSGEFLWGALTERQSYTTPLLFNPAGQPDVLIVTASRALGLNLADHTVRWQVPWKVQYDNAITTPVVVSSNRFVLSAGYGTGAALVEVTPGPGGEWTAKTVWQNRNLKTKFNAPVLFEGHLYGLDEGVLACVDVNTGERLWRDGRYGYGQLLLASGHLIILAGEGDLALVRASPDGFHEVCRVPALNGKTWNVPALAHGRLLIRNSAAMACYDLRIPGSATAH